MAATFKLHPEKRIGFRRNAIMDFFITDAPCQRSKAVTVRRATEAAVEAVQKGNWQTVYTRATQDGVVYVAYSDIKQFLA